MPAKWLLPYSFLKVKVIGKRGDVMRRILLILTVAAFMVVLSVRTALAFSSAACNQGTKTAHSQIPEGKVSHEKVPECH